MSKPQDIFGSSPKTILNKPFMQVRERESAGVNAGNSVIGENDRNLNTVITNEISGASLVSGDVVLPAGTYYMEGWSCFFDASSTTLVGSRGRSIVHANSVEVLRGINTASAESVGVATPVSGQVILTGSTTITLITHITTQAEVTRGLGMANNDGGDEVFAELNIWKLDSDVDTVQITDPSMTLKHPLFHAQHQLSSGTDGGASVIGLQDRLLNTVVTSDIIGAVLAGNEITLPAGRYYIESESCSTESGYSRNYITKADNTVLLQGMNDQSDRINTSTFGCRGEITLSASTAIKVRNYFQLAKTVTGLGDKFTTGDVEIYVDIRIWQLDTVIKTPIIQVIEPVQAPITGAHVTGNIYGGNLYDAAVTYRVYANPWSCMADDGVTPLYRDSANVCELVGGTPAVNTVYNIFACKRTSDGAHLLYEDTSVTGANLTGIDAKRWLGFVRTNGSSEICKFVMMNDTIIWTNVTENIIQNTLSTTWFQVDHSSFLPESRIAKIHYGLESDGSSYWVRCSETNGSPITADLGECGGTANLWTSADRPGGVNLLPFNPDRWFDAEAANINLAVHQVEVFR